MRVYLDHAATSPMPAEVAEAYTAELTRVGNPSSLHAEGQAARLRLETAREALAGHLGASSPAEVVLTSGGTEADNLAVTGIYAARNADRPRPRLFVSAIEHPAVMETAEFLGSRGAELVVLRVDAAGRLDLTAAEAALTDDPDRTALVSVMYANNEIGTLQPIAELTALAAAHGIPVHSDAVQACGQLDLDFAGLGLAAMSVSAHKIGGPVGVGALLLRRDITPVPVLHGGGQERSVRSGTLNVAGAVGFAAAVEHAAGRPVGEMVRLRDRLIGALDELDGVTVTGARGEERLPGNVHAVFAGCEGDALLFLLDAAGFATSTGSACNAGVSRPSAVLMACGADEDTARSVQRFSLGPETTEAEVDRLIAALPDVISRARAAGMVSAAPSWHPATASGPATTSAGGRS